MGFPVCAALCQGRLVVWGHGLSILATFQFTDRKTEAERDLSVGLHNWEAHVSLWKGPQQEWQVYNDQLLQHHQLAAACSGIQNGNFCVWSLYPLPYSPIIQLFSPELPSTNMYQHPGGLRA